MSSLEEKKEEKKEPKKIRNENIEKPREIECNSFINFVTHFLILLLISRILWYITLTFTFLKNKSREKKYSKLEGKLQSTQNMILWYRYFFSLTSKIENEKRGWV